MARKLRDAGLAVTSVQTRVHSIFPDRMAGEPESAADRLEAFKQGLDFWSEALEIENLPFILIAGMVPDQDLRSGWSEARRWIKEAARFAESRGARIAFEPLAPSMMDFDTFVYGLDQGIRMMDAAESDAAWLVIDAWHVWEERDLERRLREVAPRVAVVHACDWPEGGPRGLDDRVLPGDGIIPLQTKIFAPLRAGGYEGSFTLEILSN